ncbi:alpha/beta fold hydrolase [Piscinibacter sp.]|uniref:alpha/beta fold hydrolase n=1 Tax=Piscinibacter sp. TaxID=1903157 RepID=UPI0039E23D6A
MNDIETFDLALPHGITLSCRAAGTPGAPLLVFLHGFPEGAFVWDALLAHFAPRFRCVAPNLRGYERSSAPAEVEAYRAKHLVADIAALIESLGGRAAALVAHDWGGALAWALAAQHPQRIERLVIVNAPHPAIFLRELRDNPAQRSASGYMNFLCRPDAPALLAENDFERLWPFFERMGALDAARPGGGWLNEAVRAQYRAVWRHGLAGGCNYYRASPLRPPAGPDDPLRTLELPAAMVTVRVPTHVVWGEADLALPPALLDGLDAFVPRLTVSRVSGATHWIVHEQPARVAAEIERALAGPAV